MTSSCFYELINNLQNEFQISYIVVLYDDMGETGCEILNVSYLDFVVKQMSLLCYYQLNPEITYKWNVKHNKILFIREYWIEKALNKQNTIRNCSVAYLYFILVFISRIACKYQLMEFH